MAAMSSCNAEHHANTLKLENTLLRQKLATLTSLCADHKSKYEQTKAKFHVDLNIQQDAYQVHLEHFKRQISNQKCKLDSLQQRLQTTQQDLETKDQHLQQTQQSLESLQEKLHSHRCHVFKLERESRQKDEEMDRLKQAVYSKDEEIALLNEQLSSLSEIIPGPPSPTATRKIDVSLRPDTPSHISITAATMSVSSASATPETQQQHHYMYKSAGKHSKAMRKAPKIHHYHKRINSQNKEIHEKLLHYKWTADPANNHRISQKLKVNVSISRQFVDEFEEFSDDHDVLTDQDQDEHEYEHEHDAFSDTEDTSMMKARKSMSFSQARSSLNSLGLNQGFPDVPPVPLAKQASGGSIFIFPVHHYKRRSIQETDETVYSPHHKRKKGAPPHSPTTFSGTRSSSVRSLQLVIQKSETHLAEDVNINADANDDQFLD